MFSLLTVFVGVVVVVDTKQNCVYFPYLKTHTEIHKPMVMNINTAGWMDGMGSRFS